LPDLRLISPPPRADLLRQLRGRLGHAVPGGRLIAEGLMGADAPIDFVTLDPSGRAVLILVGDHGHDLELVGRGLAQRAWVAARLGDWIQLAPNLGLRPDSEVRVLLLCPSFTPETRVALRAVGRDVMAPVIYRCVENGASFEVLVEHAIADEPEGRAPEPQPDPATAPAAAAPFRTGLTDADLGLTPEELREFE
jgi:hypothetical protein